MDGMRKVKIFCLPFAGGSSYSYRIFQKYTANFIHLILIDLPGRGRRFCEPLLTNIHEMVEDVLDQIRSELMSPYAIFGHSLGAKLGYLLAQRIIQEKLPVPSHLFFSGSEGPSVEPREKNRHLLPREKFREIIRRFEGTPAEVLENSEMMELFEPILRADFEAVETYVYGPREPFDIPLTVMIGQRDKVGREEALRWQEMTKGKISLLEFSGGHFFIFKHLAEIGRILSQWYCSSGMDVRRYDRDSLWTP